MNGPGAHQLNAMIHSSSPATAATSQNGTWRLRSSRIHPSIGARSVPSSGMAAHASRYARMPAPPKKAAVAKSTRNSTGSSPK